MCLLSCLPSFTPSWSMHLLSLVLVCQSKAWQFRLLQALCLYRTGRQSTFSDSASSRVAKAVSVLLESVCRDLTLSLRFPSCLSLSRSCSCRFSIWVRKARKNSNITQVKSIISKPEQYLKLVSLSLSVTDVSEAQHTPCSTRFGL